MDSGSNTEYERRNKAMGEPNEPRLRHRYLRRYHRLPEPVRVSITGILGTAVGWLTYELLYWLNPVNGEWRATTSWLIGFLIGVARQHGLHRWFTFTHYSPYWKSLGRAYVFYAATTAITSAANYYLTAVLGLHHRLAYFICLTISGLMTLLFIKRFVFAAEPSPGPRSDAQS